ncbi:MAG: hypothetical protein ACLGHY_07205, partial [Gammaproteobacteria bacterium]
MSSLGISVLILALAAIAAVVAVNLAQALGRRKRLSEGRAKSRDPGSSVGDDDSVVAPAPAPRPAPPAQRAARREPRLGEVSDPADVEYDHTVPDEGGKAAAHAVPGARGAENETAA